MKENIQILETEYSTPKIQKIKEIKRRQFKKKEMNFLKGDTKILMMIIYQDLLKHKEIKIRYQSGILSHVIMIFKKFLMKQEKMHQLDIIMKLIIPNGNNKNNLLF